MQTEPITLKYKVGATPLSFEDAAAIFTASELEAGESRFQIETDGPRGSVSKVTGLVVSMDLSGPTWEWNGRDYTIHGRRSMSPVTPEGYGIRGRVSIGGRKRRAFDSSHLFELPDGRLIKAAVLHTGIGR